MSHGRYMTGSEQTSEFAPFDESGNIQPDSTRADRAPLAQ
jgi:hypothetical protein